MFTFRVFLLMLLAMVCEAVKKHASDGVSDTHMVSLLLTALLLMTLGGCCFIGTVIFVTDICIARR